MAQGGSLPPGEQRAMAEGMVAQLEARLENEPGNLDGWVMLMRSRMTLGEPQKASEALVKAIAANPEEEDELRRQAEMLGVG
jgi:cytochrome c-type biogenesis protein CcmH